MRSIATQKPVAQKGTSKDVSNDNLSKASSKERKVENDSLLASTHGQLHASGGDNSNNTNYGMTNFHKISILPPSSAPLQPKLKINAPNDKYEQEADRVADQVMRMPVQTLQRKADKEDKFRQTPNFTIQRKCSSCQEDETIQTKSLGNSPNLASPRLVNQIQNTKGRGQGLERNTKTFMESRFCADFSKVRIHNNSQASGMNREINAKAFTVGNDIYFNQGNYNPASSRSKKLLAHELTHTIQQNGSHLGKDENSSQSIQRKGETFVGFFQNIGRGIASIFGDELEYSDEEIQAYIDVLKAGDIEGDYVSDDKARAIVRKWKAGSLKIKGPLKVLLIKEMLKGYTGAADENSILDILKGSPGELTYILTKVKLSELRDDFHGSQFKELEKILIPWEKRWKNVKPEDLAKTDTKKENQEKILGDDGFTMIWKTFLSDAILPIKMKGLELEEGMNLSEFDLYIRKQADWFTEDSLKNNEVVRNKLWEIAFLLGEGNHNRVALGRLKMLKLTQATKGEMKALKAYAAGVRDSKTDYPITSEHEKFFKVVAWGEAMIELKKFVPDLVMKVVINQDFLNKLVFPNDLVQEFKKYYKEFTPTIEVPDEKRGIIKLLDEGILTYMDLKPWMHDIHIIDTKSRLKLLDNVRVENNKKPVLLVLFSGLDHNAAFLYWANLKSVILNENNLALVIQGEKSVNDLTARVKEVAAKYGQPNKPGGDPKLKQVIIAGHGSQKTIQQTTTGKPSKDQKDDKHVVYEMTSLSTGKPGSDTEKLVDALLEVLDTENARIVFAGCSVGGHSIPLDTQLKTDPETAAENIKEALKLNPNLRDLVIRRAKELKLKNKPAIEAAVATTTASAFNIDDDGKAKLHKDDDPAIGKEVQDYVKEGTEPSGALKAALETWADKKYGPVWTTEAMRDYVKDNKPSKKWWMSMTRTGYKIALPKKGNVNPEVLNKLSYYIKPWFKTLWMSSVNVEKIVNTTKKVNALENLGLDSDNFPVSKIAYSTMVASKSAEYSGHIKIAVYQAWMQVNDKKPTDFLAAVGDSHLKGKKLFSLFRMKYLKKHLTTLLKAADPKKPTGPQLKLALNLASNLKQNMPEAVKTLLINAAENKRRASFPVALNVSSYLEGIDEIDILGFLGLALGKSDDSPSPPTPPKAKGSKSKSPPKSSKKLANADLDSDPSKNESFISVAPKKIKLKTEAPVWEKPDLKSKILTTLSKGTIMRVAGSRLGWAVIDYNGTVAYVDMALLD